jgi:hypothetical protein
MLPHLTHLTSFHFRVYDTTVLGLPSVARSVWSSFLVNKIRLSDVTIEGVITEETIFYLLSFSGLKRLVVNSFTPSRGAFADNIKDMLFTEVLLKHVNSLQTLKVDIPWVRPLALFSVLLSP